jgi:hypothetical protein
MIRNIWRIQDSYAMKAVVELQTASRNILMLFLSSGCLWHWHFVSVLSRGVWDNVVYMATCNKQEGQELEPPWGRDFLDPFKPAPRPIQPPVEPGLYPGGKAVGAWSWTCMGRTVPLISVSAYLAYHGTALTL